MSYIFLIRSGLLMTRRRTMETDLCMNLAVGSPLYGIRAVDAKPIDIRSQRGACRPNKTVPLMGRTCVLDLSAFYTGYVITAYCFVVDKCHQLRR